MASRGSIWVCSRSAVVSCSRPGRTGEVHSGQPSGAVITWMFPPWLSCLPDHHKSTPGGGTWGAAPVGLDQGPVDVDVVVAGHLRREQRRFQGRRLGGQHADTLVQVVVGGGPADRVVA